MDLIFFSVRVNRFNTIYWKSSFAQKQKCHFNAHLHMEHREYNPLHFPTVSTDHTLDPNVWLPVCLFN